MAGGEFVMNNRAVRKYGLGFMGRLNGGLIPTMQAGGPVTPAPLNSQTGANTNNISISVNTGGGGGDACGQEPTAARLFSPSFILATYANGHAARIDC